VPEHASAKPRLRGEPPQHLGQCARLAPSTLFNRIERMKQQAFRKDATLDGSYRRGLPTAV
jgi:hypothetical protein